MPFYQVAAFAGRIFQASAVFNFHRSAAECDQASLPLNPGGNCNARKSCAQHVSEELMRQRNDVTADSVLSHQQSAREPFADLVEPTVQTDLYCASEAALLVFENVYAKRSNGCMKSGYFEECSSCRR